MIKDFVKRNILSQNSYLNMIVHQINDASRAKEMRALYDEMKSWDTIKDVSPLKQFRQEIAKGRIYNTMDPNLACYVSYGYWQAVFGKYLKKYNDIIKMPAMEHGLVIQKAVYSDLAYTARPTFVTMCDRRKHTIHEFYKRPVFSIGPYIHYADGFYDKKKNDAIKRILGRVLLVFPTHSNDASTISLNEDIFCERLKTIAKDFDNVIINAYWWNINDRIIEKLQAEGYHIASAGFREDSRFINRLKTMIDLSDLVIGDSIGTHIGFCVAENKPFKLVWSNTKIKIQDLTIQKSLDDVKKQFGQIETCFDEATEITKEQIDICNKYWGLNKIKTQSEISSIIKISEMIFQKCHGNLFLEPLYIDGTLRELSETDPQSYKLLYEAIR